MEKKILMVCLGNICRSPLAEGIMQDLVDQHNLNWSVDSAGTANYHSGELPDERSIEVAKENGIDLTTQRARQFVAKDFDRFDHILVMDSSNYNNVLALATAEAHKEKVELLLNYANPGMNQNVPDPYYSGGFPKVFEMVQEACVAFVKKTLN